MKSTVLKESSVLLDVRRIKEEIALEAAADPTFYQHLNGEGAKLLARYRRSRSRRTAKTGKV